jgi:hypothetical protein
MSTDHQKIKRTILSMSKEMYKIKSGKNNLLKKCLRCPSLIIQRLLFIIDKILFFVYAIYNTKNDEQRITKNWFY